MESWNNDAAGELNVGSSSIPDSLLLIAGRADYPLLLALAARKQGVQRIVAVAFKGETRREIRDVADETIWIRAGRLTAFLDAVRSAELPAAVMAGQVSPKNLFNVRMDRALFALLKKLPVKNAHTIFGAIIAEVEKTGVHLLPASSFMQNYIPDSGLLTRRAPDGREEIDIQIGRRVIKDTSHLDIGQTVIVKEGMVLAVEAFEGTNRAIRRGGKLGGQGAVVVKVPKLGHDMRFDIPIIGMQTLRTIRKAGVSCLALEAGGAILLDQEKFAAQADAAGLAVTVLEKDTAAEHAVL
jgi:UDP-2,3-diacylglucosamine hydrolase